MRIRINRQIRVPEVRVIDSEGGQLGIMATAEALRMAEEMGFDLVEISPNSKPPVCRIMDFGKYKYELNKRLKQSKKKQHVINIKEIKLRPKTEEHDYQFKKRHAENFLKKRNKVKVTVVFRGRELTHKEMGEKILERIKEDLTDVGVVEKPIYFEGRFMTIIITPITVRPPVKQTAKPSEPHEETKDSVEEKQNAEDEVE